MTFKLYWRFITWSELRSSRCLWNVIARHSSCFYEYPETHLSPYTSLFHSDLQILEGKMLCFYQSEEWFCCCMLQAYSKDGGR